MIVQNVTGERGLIRVIIADDHPMVRDGTRAYLERAPDITVVGVAGEGEAVLELVRRSPPDVVLLDIHLPDLSGLEVVRRLRTASSNVGILILTGYDEVGFIRPLIQLGIQGYLSKTASAEAIIVAVRRIARGEVVLEATTTSIAGPTLAEPLTSREFEVLKLVVAGERNREIAASLCISVKTVEFHISHVLAKLGARSRTEAVHTAREFGLLH